MNSNYELFCQEANKLLIDRGYYKYNYFQDKNYNIIHFNLYLLCFYSTSWETIGNGKKHDSKKLIENIPLTIMWLNELFEPLIKTYKIKKSNIHVLGEVGGVNHKSTWFDFANDRIWHN